jgi:O-antigen/teichoic acid export membrane protein
MKNNHFFKGLSWLIFLNLLIKPIWIFAIDRQVQNSVGHQTYGSYFALVNLSFVLLFIADAGLGNMLTQRIAAKEVVSIAQLVQLKLLFLVLYSFACYFIAWLTHVAQWNLLFYIILIQVLTSLFIFLRSLLTANQLFTTDAFFSVLDKGLMILLCGAAIYGAFTPITILLFVQLQAGTTAASVAILFILLVRKNFLTQANKQQLGDLLKWTAPFTVIILLMSVHYKLDGFLLERLHPAGALQAGIYAGAFRLLDAANMLGYLSASFLVAFIARHKDDRIQIQRVVLITRHLLLFISIVASCFIFQFAPWVQQLLYHTTDDYSSRVLQLCLSSLPAYYLVHVYGSALTATANFRLFTTVLGGSVVLNILLNLWLIPLYGATGCCIAALVSQYSCGIVLYIATTRKLRLSYSALSLLLYAVGAGFLLLLFYYSKMAVSNVWIILAAVAFFAAVVFITQRQYFKEMFFSVIK